MLPKRGEVWQVDLGVTAKVRPALVISAEYSDMDRALIGVIPHTTATRGSQFEIPLDIHFLQAGGFLVQGLQAIPPKYFLRRLGFLSPEQIKTVEQGILRWLSIKP